MHFPSSVLEDLIDPDGRVECHCPAQKASHRIAPKTWYSHRQAYPEEDWDYHLRRHTGSQPSGSSNDTFIEQYDHMSDVHMSDFWGDNGSEIDLAHEAQEDEARVDRILERFDCLEDEFEDGSKESSEEEEEERNESDEEGDEDEDEDQEMNCGLQQEEVSAGNGLEDEDQGDRNMQEPLDLAFLEALSSDYPTFNGFNV
jgi:hypothetical protein